MQSLHTLNFNDFSPNEICTYLADRYFVQVLHNFDVSKKYLITLYNESHDQNIEWLNTIFDILHEETKHLFSKDKILLFPHLVTPNAAGINLEPVNEIHKKIIGLLSKIRNSMNNYIAQPNWSSTQKICCNELFNLEQSLLYVLYIKENFIWTRSKTNFINETY